MLGYLFDRLGFMTSTYKHYSWYNLIDYSYLSNKYTKVKNIKIPNKKSKTAKFKESRLYYSSARMPTNLLVG